MRRCLHSLLVGVLTFSLSVDAARACGHLRRWRQTGACCCATVVVVPRAIACDPCGAVFADGCGWAGPVYAVSTIETCGGWEEIACGASLDCCGPVGPAAAPTVVAVETPASDAVAAVPQEASGVANEPTPAVPPPQPVASAVPELEPVEPVSAIEPAVTEEPDLTIPRDVVDEPVAPAPEAAPEPAVVAAPHAIEEPVAPSPAAVEDAPAVTPQPRNIFEEADAAGDEEPPAVDGAVTAPNQPAEEVPADAVPLDPAAEDPQVVPGSADQPAIETPADDLPTIEPELPAGPAAESAAAVEPLRRWIDDTAAYAVVGRLVEVRGDTVEILKADGRSVSVPLERLSGFDRGYVTAAAPRIAAARRSTAPPTDTASR